MVECKVERFRTIRILRQLQVMVLRLNPAGLLGVIGSDGASRQIGDADLPSIQKSDATVAERDYLADDLVVGILADESSSKVHLVDLELCCWVISPCSEHQLVCAPHS